MKTEKEISGTMYKDFISAQKEFEPARKQSLNPHFKSKYADLSNCVDAVKDALNNNHFALLQKTHDCDNGVAIETILLHESGESITSGILKIPASKHDAQGYGSAMSYARRYSLLAVCGIAPEDDDGNAAKPVTNKSNAIDLNESFLNKKKAMFERFESAFNVNEKQILNLYKRDSIAEFSENDLSDLVVLGTKIKDGKIDVKVAFEMI